MTIFWNLMGAIANIPAETARAFVRETLSWLGFDNDFRLCAIVARRSFDLPADIVVFGVATLALIPLLQAARRPGQSNFEVEARFMVFGRRGAGLKSAPPPQYLLLFAGLIFYVIGMIN
jgi:hypothetical protein